MKKKMLFLLSLFAPLYVFAQAEFLRYYDIENVASEKLEYCDGFLMENEIDNSDYETCRLFFCGDFSQSAQNYALEVKKMGRMWYYGGGVNAWLWNGKFDDLFGYAILGVSFAFKRVRPYIELGGGLGGVDISRSINFGIYAYVKGALEVRISPNFSIDAFCKSQYAKSYKDDSDYSAGNISGGASVTFWMIR